MRALLLAGAMSCAVIGCRTTKTPPVDAAAARVDQALTRGTDEAGEVGPIELRVRHNPAPCECPPYEVYAYGRWMRAFIDGTSAAVSALQNADPLATATVVGVVEPSPRAAENGVTYPVVTPQ